MTDAVFVDAEEELEIALGKKPTYEEVMDHLNERYKVTLRPDEKDALIEELKTIARSSNKTTADDVAEGIVKVLHAIFISIFKMGLIAATGFLLIKFAFWIFT